ncbi:MAG: hypothetical protein O3B86_11875, partial [Planctomycetota bacterium]|nr:hypothetical protein [Planctomycetota bacterium]
MSLRPWLTGFRARLNHSRLRRDARLRAARPQQSLQQLEQRTLLTATALTIGTDVTVLTDANEKVVVTPNATTGRAEVFINDVVLSSGSSVPAASLTGLTIITGSGDNRIDLSGITSAVFTSLASIEVDSGDGDDTILGAADITSTLAGGDGNDSIVGGTAADVIRGNDGQDTIESGDGDDDINAGDGDDSVVAGAGNDTITGDDGEDTIFGGDGDDSVIANNGADVIFGEAGNDTINGDGGFDSIDGGDGNDLILGGADNDTVSGGLGDDTINGQSGNDSINGDDGNDSIIGQGGRDTLNGDAGNDIINGNAGDDSLLGNDGNDTIFGGSGNDDADGGLGDDTIRGNSGDDTLCGGRGFDLIAGDTGNDLITSICEVGTPTGLAVGDLNIAEGGTADVVLIVDRSTSTRQPFFGNAVGDVNGDGFADTVFDAELASLLAFQADLVIRGVTANLSIITFESNSTIVDMNPATVAVDLTTTPTADLNNNGTPDFIEIVQSLQIAGATNFEPPLQDAISVFTTLGSGADGTMVFLSDGQPFDTGAFADEVATLNGLGITLRAFGVGLGAFLPDLQVIDPMAQIVTTSQGLAMALTGLGVSGQNSFVDVVLSAPAPVAFDVDFSTTPGTATAGVDYSPVTGTISFAMGQTTATIAVNIQSDLVVEGPETFFVVLSNPRTISGMPIPFELSDPVSLVTIYDLGAVFPAATPPPPPTPMSETLVDVDPDGDTLIGNDGNDTIIGDLGNDSINGSAGDDSISAGSGNDSVLGGSGRDTIDGQAGDDTLDGQGGADVVTGGDGDDVIIFEGDESGNDTIFGGNGGDTVIVNTGVTDDMVVVAQDIDGRMTVTEGGSTLVIDASISSVFVNGQAGADTITIGDLSSVSLSALTVDGGQGDDTIDGSGLVAGTVRVQLRGGDGNDT